MGTRKFWYNKLVRDNVLESMHKNWSKVDYRILDDKVFFIELKRKLLEEVFEFDKVTNPKDLLKELADINEVLDQILELKWFTQEELDAMQKKHIEKWWWWFDKKIFINTVEPQEWDKRIKYYEENPNKYPEI
jgi:predicted house-cleaning noncanonical NTP pyrophosphatase (MazG superfamily)